VEFCTAANINKNINYIDICHVLTEKKFLYDDKIAKKKAATKMTAL
jgi:hypothetical protein